MKKFAMKKFTVSPRIFVAHIWGGGHTPDTDPGRQGWRCVPVRGLTKVWVVGQKGKEGCASFRPLPKGRWDVALYLEGPREVALELSAGRSLDARYVQVTNTPGFGLTIIEEIEADRAWA